jgi:hypothetical protein
MAKSQSLAVRVGALPVRKLVEMQCRVDLGHDDTEIGVAMGIEPAEIGAIVDREHWRERHLATPEQQMSKANADALLGLRYERAIQARARMLTFAGMDLAASAADAGDPRGFKDAAQGAKLMHDMAIGTEAGEGKQGAPSIVAFFIEGERPAVVREEKVVSVAEPDEF